MAQMKEQNKTPGKELIKVEISNRSDAELKTLVIRMLKELSEDFCSINKIQSEMKDILIEIKNNFQGNNSRVDEAKNPINDLNTGRKKQPCRTIRKKEEKNEDSINSLWDNFKRSNIHIIGVPQGEESKKLEIYLKK